MTGYVADTSIFVATEQLRPLGTAPALVHDLTVWTQDDDFDVLAELAPARRIYRG